MAELIDVWLSRNRPVPVAQIELRAAERNCLVALVGLPFASYALSKIANIRAANGKPGLRRALRRNFKLTKAALDEGRWWTYYLSIFAFDDAVALVLNQWVWQPRELSLAAYCSSALAATS